jgi:serine acetyltransferase
MNKKSLYQRISCRILNVLAQSLPGAMSLRPMLHRMRGAKIERGVFIGDQVYLENEYPENIEIGEDSQIGIRSILIAHFRGGGKIVIGKKVWIGPNCVISANVDKTLTIGDGAVIGAASVITSDVPPGVMILPPKPTIVAEVRVPLTIKTSYEDFMQGLKPIPKKSIR